MKKICDICDKNEIENEGWDRCENCNEEGALAEIERQFTRFWEGE